MKKIIVAILAATFASVAFACSSSSSSGAAAAGSCASPWSGADACGTCVQASCASDYSAFCSDGCGTQANDTSSSCQSATETLGTCISTNCATQCNSGPNAGGGGTTGSGGSTGAGGSTAAGGGTVTGANCQMLAACCPKLPDSTNQSSCNSISQGHNDSACGMVLADYVGYCGSSAGGVCNVPSMFLCGNGSLSASCSAIGGTMQASCPSDNLIGCCTISATEVCEYTGISQTPTQSSCESSGGTWSTTPNP